MKQLTRREVLRRSVLPLAALTGTGGLAAGLARAGGGGPGTEVSFATVLSATGSSLTVARDEGEELTIPVTAQGPAARPLRGNPFQVGERVVLDLDAGGNVVGVEPLADAVSGVVDSHRGSRLSVDGAGYVVDEWSLARLGHDGTGSVVGLQATTLSPGTHVNLLVRRHPGRGARRVAAVFAG